MNYELGLQALELSLKAEEGEVWRDFSLFKAQLLENLNQERRFGTTETLKSERYVVVDKLNILALSFTGLSFTDLCLGKHPPYQAQKTKVLAGKTWKGDGATTDSDTFYGAGQRWAVLIGVNEYEDKSNYGQLHVCTKDADAIREQLITGGFDPTRIRQLTDQTLELPTRDNILVALKAVADATESDDLLLFYYSGHGDEDGDESYLVARNGRLLVLRDTAVPVSRVREIMEQSPARAKVMVLDACHSGANIGQKGPKRMSAEFIRRVFEQAAGLAILASCKQGQLSYEWRAQERSVFTHFFLEALKGEADQDEKGFVTIQDANRHVTNGVKLWASQKNVAQTPTLQYTVAGDIILTTYNR